MLPFSTRFGIVDQITPASGGSRRRVTTQHDGSFTAVGRLMTGHHQQQYQHYGDQINGVKSPRSTTLRVFCTRPGVIIIISKQDIGTQLSDLVTHISWAGILQAPSTTGQAILDCIRITPQSGLKNHSSHLAIFCSASVLPEHWPHRPCRQTSTEATQADPALGLANLRLLHRLDSRRS